MLLAIDIGNTNISLGLFEQEVLAVTARLETCKGKTADEYAVQIKDVLALYGHDASEVEDCVISSVVPSVGAAISAAVAANSVFFLPQSLTSGKVSKNHFLITG